MEGGVKAYDHADTTREMRTSARSTRAWGKRVNETERGLKVSKGLPVGKSAHDRHMSIECLGEWVS
jgi:biotin synthase-like enzyme